MGSINKGRSTADIEGDFFAFIIGARPNPLRLIRNLRDLGGNRGMKHMLDYLAEHGDIGLLGYEQLGIGSWVQYWRSFDHLEAFAKNKGHPHLEVWRNYFKRVGKSARTGIWHESFLVRAGGYESIYTNMPDVGLAKASNVVAVGDSTTARNRLKTTKAWRPVGCDPTVSPTAASRPLFVGQRVPDPGEESRTSSTRPRCASRSALRDHRPFATGRSPRGRHPRGRSPERRVPTRRGRRVRARARAARRWFGRVRWTCASPSPRQRDRRPSRVDLRRRRTGRTGSHRSSPS